MALAHPHATGVAVYPTLFLLKYMLVMNHIFSWPYWNKAGYTAKTSRGRVGRGENARFQLERDEPTDRWEDGQTDGQSLL